MKETLKSEIIKIAKPYYPTSDPSHDWAHIQRVLKNAELIWNSEGWYDEDILFPSVLFHDLINPPKNLPEAHLASEKSAELAGKILCTLDCFPKEKINNVQYAISVCSFNKNIRPETHEAMILQDADLLEATGSIAIMRTFSSAGQYGTPFYSEIDTFCETREPSQTYAIDFFYKRLLVVASRMNTKKWKELAQERTRILTDFLLSLKDELS